MEDIIIGVMTTTFIVGMFAVIITDKIYSNREDKKDD